MQPPADPASSPSSVPLTAKLQTLPIGLNLGGFVPPLRSVSKGILWQLILSMTSRGWICNCHSKPHHEDDPSLLADTVVESLIRLNLVSSSSQPNVISHNDHRDIRSPPVIAGSQRRRFAVLYFHLNEKTNILNSHIYIGDVDVLGPDRALYR